MLKDLRQVLSEVGLKFHWHETALLLLVLTGCGFLLLWFGYGGW